MVKPERQPHIEGIFCRRQPLLPVSKFARVASQEVGLLPSFSSLVLARNE